MTVSVTIRDLPNETRDILAARAARSGRSLQEYLSHELRQLAGRPSVAEALTLTRERAKHFPPITSDEIVDDLDADRR